MQASDYFEDFGEKHEIDEEEEGESLKVKQTGKGKKSRQQQGKDKLNGELEHLALGEEDQVRTTFLRQIYVCSVRYASIAYFLSSSTKSMFAISNLYAWKEEKITYDTIRYAANEARLSTFVACSRYFL